MEIQPGKVVELAYNLYSGEGTDEDSLMQKVTNEYPDRFIIGTNNQVLPLLEKNLLGLKQGDKFDIFIPMKDAFGERNEEHVMDLNKEIFVVEGEFDDKVIFEGNSVPMMTATGERIMGHILKITEDKVIMDFNHPLAGEDLHFVGEVLLVRDATEEELNPKCGCGCGHDHGDGCGDGECGGCDGYH